jgi:PAS domain S-box-containing protein
VNVELLADRRVATSEVLLVVADDALRSLVAQALDRGGCEVIECSTGRAGLAFLDTRRPDLLLLDDALADMTCEMFLDGFAADAAPPWVFLANRGNESQAARMADRGAREVLVKGLDLLGLLPAIVEKTLSRVADERHLADTQRLLRLTRFAVDHAAEAMFTVSPEGRVLDANATASRWLELSRDELRGLRLEELSPEPAALDWPALWAALRREGRADGQTLYRSRSGRVFPVEFVAAFLRFEGAEYGCISARDITERKAAELRLAEHQAELEEAVRVRTRELERTHERLRQTERLASVGTLAAGFAHEMNNPLGAIRLSAENALEALCDSQARQQSADARPEDALAVKLLGDVVSYTERCARIVASLMRLAWQESPRLEHHGVNDVVRLAVERTSRYALACGARIELELTEGLPTIDMAEGEMVQAVGSLLENACESRARGAVIRVRTFADDARVSIVVEDNGQGIGGAQRPRIFEPFFTTKKEQGGVGLGLTLAHAMVSASRGEIDVQSEVGKGSRFRISFPRTDG